MKTITSNNPDTTIKLGKRLGRLLKKGSVVALSGEFGAGKTTLIKGIARGLGVKDIRYVNSPSFVIVKEYKGKLPVYHFDIHRLEKAPELESVGYEEYFYGNGVTLVEWAEKIRGLLPQEYLDIHLTNQDQSTRVLELRSVGEKYTKVVKAL